MTTEQDINHNAGSAWIRGSRGILVPVHIVEIKGSIVYWEDAKGVTTGTCHRSDLIEEIGHGPGEDDLG